MSGRSLKLPNDLRMAHPGFTALPRNCRQFPAPTVTFHRLFACHPWLGRNLSVMAKRAVDLDQLRQLPVTERLQLVEDLWDTIADEAPDDALPLSPELAAELDRRLAEHAANPRAARPWTEIRADLIAGRRSTR